MAHEVVLKIQRFDPAKDKEPYYKEYKLMVEDMDRVLDCLHTIKWKYDGTLAFRRSCGHGMCGSDAMKINGRNRLACQVLVRELGSKITVEPIPGFQIIKDLIVDMEPFYEKLELVKPYLVNDEPAPVRERLQSQEEVESLDRAISCILCGSCTSSCPSFWTHPDYLGPAAFLKAYRFIFDTRDRAGLERLDRIDDSDGLWRCHTIFNCVEACPREINLTWHISKLKQKAVSRNL